MNKYVWLVIAGAALWIAETAAFGFNDKAASGLESALDLIASTMIFWGIGGDILQNVNISKVTNITAQIPDEDESQQGTAK